MADPFHVVASGFGLLEGPTVGPEGELYVSDVTQGGVYRIDRGGSPEVVVPKRRGVGGIALHADGGLVLSGRDVQHVREGTVRTLLTAEEGVTGFNDLCCDAAGRIYVGAVRFHVFDPAAVVVPGELVHLQAPGHAPVVADGVVHPNGVGLSADGRTLFHSDTRGRRLLVLELDAEGAVEVRRHVALDGPGHPDGLAVDTEGCAWVALVGEGCIVQVTPAGELARRLEVPARWVTSLCFDGDELVVVTADHTGDPALGGCVLRTPIDLTGAPVHPARL